MSSGNGDFQIGTVVAEGRDGAQPPNAGLGWVPVAVGSKGAAVVWARMLMPYATKEAGFAIYPEVGDQVLILGMGVEYICMGALYNKKIKAKVSNDEGNKYGKNYIKEFRTPAGTGITINDEKDKEYFWIDVKDGLIQLQLDIGQKSIIVDGDAKTEKIDIKASKAEVSVEVKDATVKATDAVVEFKSSKINVKCAEITIKSDGAVTVEGGGKVVLKGSAVEIC